LAQPHSDKKFGTFIMTTAMPPSALQRAA